MVAVYPIRERVCSAEQAVALIQSHSRVFLSGNCAVPQRVLGALVERAQELQAVEIVQVLTIGNADYVAPELAGRLRVNPLFISDNVRDAVNQGRADFTPCFLSEIPELFTSGRLPPDVAPIQVSPPDEHGYCSFGVEVGVTKPAAQAARLVIAEMNPHLPRTLGDAFIHLSHLDVIVPVDYPLPELPTAPVDALTERIAEHVAGLIPDGATLQTGLGAIPNAVLGRLTGHRDLGLHTELFSDGVVDLVLRGVITGERKTLHPGKIISGFILGTQCLYDFVPDNPIVELHPTDYVNDPLVIAQNDRLVAINSAIEIDLTGQVCADSIGCRPYSGVGSQADFIYGAARSKGGRPIIALPSTVRPGRGGPTVSRITPTLRPGAGVTTTRRHVRFVVTAHGVADLHGQAIAQRAQALIKIAAPQFHEQLCQQAHQLNYV